ncbi:MAG TPA: methylmalonyl-CoA mutase family protein [Cyclobacteriaceae bacterium]|nr:methylmalonyl-CoA mutase family protein [Cyclobacteriaceae bacterium]
MKVTDQKKFNAFKSASLTEWEIAAREELKGADPWKKLSIPLQDCTILPFYDQNEGNRPAPLLQVSENNYLGPRTWFNCPAVHVDNESNANTLALEHLRNGADGISFELDRTIDFKSLLQYIDLQYCSLIFLAKTNAQVIGDALKEYLQSENKLNNNLPVVFLGNTLLPGVVNSNFFTSGFVIPTAAMPSEEIASCFIPLLKTEPFQPQSLAFSITLGTDFFMNVAKLRAIRMNWQRLLTHKKIQEQLPCWIHARALPLNPKEFQSHGNMLNSTTAAMSAILGGCDALTLEPEDNQSLSIRIARNVSNVLREEAHFSKVADPLAGSYFVESLSLQLADAAWKSLSL